jgi:small ligand-binding sensory domain FIST
VTPRYSAAISEHPEPATAIGDAIGQVIDEVGVEPDLAAIFVTAHFRDQLADMAAAVQTVLRPGTLIGVTAESIVGGAREVEERPGVSLWAGRTGAVRAVRMEAQRDEGGWSVVGLSVDELSDHTLVLLADPYSFPVDALLAGLRAEVPDAVVIGGLASAGHAAGENRLTLDSETYRDGAIGVLIPNASRMRTIVSQGCRPIGEPLIVTRSTGNVIEELAGLSPLERLQQTFDSASEDDRTLMQRGLHVGIVIDERKAEFTRGDFLIRGLVGVDRSTGAIAVGDEVPLGTTVQFQVRDATSADEDLRHMLREVRGEAALVFTCNGRGSYLFGEPHHDASLVVDHAGKATAGFFCAGEFGPIGGANFLHGFTASILVFG